MISSSALFYGFISIDGRIWGGATAKVSIIKLVGFDLVKPKTLASSLEIPERILKTLLES